MPLSCEATRFPRSTGSCDLVRPNRALPALRKINRFGDHPQPKGPRAIMRDPAVETSGGVSWLRWERHRGGCTKTERDSSSLSAPRNDTEPTRWNKKDEARRWKHRGHGNFPLHGCICQGLDRGHGFPLINLSGLPVELAADQERPRPCMRGLRLPV